MTSRFRFACLRAAIPFAVLAALVAAPKANAHRRDFPVTYDWHQPMKGEKEIESHTDYSANEKAWEQQLEFEYGISNRFMVAPYIVYSKEDGDHFRYSAFKVESRYQLGKDQTGKVLPGLYFEFEKPKGEKAELEGKIILSTYTKQDEDYSLNLVVEKPLEKSESTRYTYSAGYARPLGHSKSQPRGGVELTRNLDDGRVNFGPVIGFEPWAKGMNRIAALLGYGFPMDHRNNNKGEFRLLVEYEFF